MVSEFDSVLFHDAVEDLDFGISSLIKNEAMVDGAGFAVRAFSAAVG